MPEITPAHFHDATISGVRRDADDVYIDIEDIIAGGARYKARLILRTVNRILRNGEEVSKLEMEQDDGEILDAAISDGEASLTVQWNNFRRKTRAVSVYQLRAAAIDIQATKIGPAP